MSEDSEITNTETPEYGQLINDCVAIVGLTKGRILKDTLIGYYQIGKRIIEYQSCPIIGQNLNQTKLAERIGITKQKLSECLRWCKYINEKYGNFEGFLEYCRNNHNEKLEGWSWYDVTHSYLPQIALGEEPIEEQKKYKIVFEPLGNFNSKENAEAYYRDDAGVEVEADAVWRIKITKKA